LGPRLRGDDVVTQIPQRRASFPKVRYDVVCALQNGLILSPPRQSTLAVTSSLASMGIVSMPLYKALRPACHLGTVPAQSFCAELSRFLSHFVCWLAMLFLRLR